MYVCMRMHNNSLVHYYIQRRYSRQGRTPRKSLTAWLLSGWREWATEDQGQADLVCMCVGEVVMVVSMKRIFSIELKYFRAVYPII